MTINGIPVDGKVSVFSTIDLFGETSSPDTVELLMKCRVSYIPDEMNLLTLYFCPFVWAKNYRAIEISRGEYKKFGINTSLAFWFDIDAKNWSHIYSFSEFNDVMNNIVRDFDALWLPEKTNVIEYGCRLVFHIKDEDATLQDLVGIFTKTVKKIHNLAESILHANINRDSLVVSFDFRQEVRIICQQYLLYFVQFLKDIGIDATANLEEHTGQVLFSVTPKDENEALDKIRQALEIYLRLPTNPSIATSITPYSDVESQRLASNILHLQSQLVLARVTIRQQEAHIERQETLIRQQQFLTGDVLIKSLVYDSTQSNNIEPSKKAEDKESLVGDIVHVRKWEPEDIPLSVDLPSIFRWLKKLFGKST